MRVVFDQNFPRRMRRFLTPKHYVRTAYEEGWGELTNGELLSTAERNGFEVMVTADQSIKYQQNLKGRQLALVVLSTNDWDILSRHPELLCEAVNHAKPGSYELVGFGRRPRQP